VIAMPVYTYRCQNCGVQFEKTQKFNDKPRARCPECRKGTVKRLLQPTAIVFKGSGWYATDHRSASDQGFSRKDEGSSDKSESTTDKSDSKPTKKEKKSTQSDGLSQVKDGHAQAAHTAELYGTTGLCA
jgi:putative FmdB family regulatory protein